MSYVFQFFELLWGVVVGLVAALKMPIVLPFVALLILLRILRANMLVWSLAWWVALYVTLGHAFKIPLPHSVITIYMTIVTGGLLAYASSSRKRWDSFLTPILRLVLEPRHRLTLAAIVVLIPLSAAFNVYRGMQVPLEAPSFGRTVHPAPPSTITVHDNTIDLVVGDNPFREMEQRDPEAFQAHLENGRRVYFQNCFWCHGDGMAGDGMFAYGLNPIPTNFTDAGILPMFQETFLFWRVSKGAPGLPEEGGPWDSAMPRWEQFLTEEEMWDAVAYLFEYTDYRPRKQEVHH
jgi:mono/diheme cytochrome c family protein